MNVRRIDGGSNPDFNQIYDPDSDSGQFRFSVSSSEDSEQEEVMEICIVRNSADSSVNLKLKIEFEFHALEKGIESVQSKVAREDHVNSVSGSVV